MINIMGRPCTLTQAAYPTVRGPQGTCYQAQAQDAMGNLYTVVWYTSDTWDDALANSNMSYLEDESNACDWDNPDIVVSNTCV